MGRGLSLKAASGEPAGRSLVRVRVRAGLLSTQVTAICCLSRASRTRVYACSTLTLTLTLALALTLTLTLTLTPPRSSSSTVTR